jgi:hypothetical protein
MSCVTTSSNISSVAAPTALGSTRTGSLGQATAALRESPPQIPKHRLQSGSGTPPTDRTRSGMR